MLLLQSRAIAGIARRWWNRAWLLASSVIAGIARGRCRPVKTLNLQPQVVFSVNMMSPWEHY